MKKQERDRLAQRFASDCPPSHAECVDILLGMDAKWNLTSDVWETGSEGNAIGGYGLPADEALREWLRFQHREDHWEERHEQVKAMVDGLRRESPGLE